MNKDGRGSYCKQWTFTLNNPGDDEQPDHVKAALGSKGYRYLVFQLEQGDNGTPHYQGGPHLGYRVG